MHGIPYTAKNRLFWTSKDRIGQKRERRFGIPMYRFQFPGITNNYGDAINRHHCDVLATNAFATKRAQQCELFFINYTFVSIVLFKINQR